MEIDIDVSQMFGATEIVFNALSGPYLFIAGLGLGVAILGAVVRAIQMVKM